MNPELVAEALGRELRHDVDVPVRREEEAVVEKDHAVAELAPSLFGVVGDDVGSAAVEIACLRARWDV